ncbi:MAG: hypothetical protein HYW26_05390 [Candidatus Aenigmarchaeota archaeon]|nr:hypothetical protein [Candidatus Aenigmarchaeota archaeon]
MNIAKTRIDSKGRISIPYHMRTSLNLDSSSEMKIAANEKEIVLTPSMDGVRVRIRFRDFPALLRVIKMISGFKVYIGDDRITNFDRRNVEWSAVLEGDSRILKNLVKKIKKYGSVKSVVLN